MKAFECFPRLPSELRQDIWELTLQEEARSRPGVLFHETHHRVMPFKYLVSPVLSVNREARSAALRFYDVKLPVWPHLEKGPVWILERMGRTC
ncbi:hypothetical protein PG999_001455 [Apiospora kogelbergensis]|uniref:2EXR domain-containing protein n=1 Tax=Apiospora kogelbergensis TaxID=1337665 RepID=A0AAW0RER0_9PEZI